MTHNSTPNYDKLMALIAASAPDPIEYHKKVLNSLRNYIDRPIKGDFATMKRPWEN
jgi:hypothetical protein